MRAVPNFAKRLNNVPHTVSWKVIWGVLSRQTLVCVIFFLDILMFLPVLVFNAINDLSRTSLKFCVIVNEFLFVNGETVRHWHKCKNVYFSVLSFAGYGFNRVHLHHFFLLVHCAFCHCFCPLRLVNLLTGRLWRLSVSLMVADYFSVLIYFLFRLSLFTFFLQCFWEINTISQFIFTLNPSYALAMWFPCFCLTISQSVEKLCSGKIFVKTSHRAVTLI